MKNIDLTVGQVFTNIGRKRTKPQLREIFKKKVFDVPSIRSNFKQTPKESFGHDTGLYFGEMSEKSMNIYQFINQEKCECCGKDINPLNSMYSLCYKCEERLHTDAKVNEALKILNINDLKHRDESGMIINFKDRVFYCWLFLISQ